MFSQIPNIITTIRLLLSSVFIYLFTQTTTHYKEAFIIFAIASLTDAIDGWMARKFSISSKFGEFLDPIADKVLTLSAFIAFAWQGIIDVWCVAIIASRDIFITIVRQAFFTKKHIPTSKPAKFKTAIQLIFIIFVLALQAIGEGPDTQIIGKILYSNDIDIAMYAITLLTVWTMFEYVLQVKQNKV